MNENNQLLRRIENNDTLLTRLEIGSHTIDVGFPSGSREEFARLGAAVATNDRLSSLEVNVTSTYWYGVPREFFDGLRRNTSIHKLVMFCSDEHNIGSGAFHAVLMACQENNDQLWHLFVNYQYVEKLY